MIGRTTRRPRPSPGRFFVTIGFALALSSITVDAQQPTTRPSADTTSARRDSTRLVRPDSTAPVPDSLRPIRRMPQLARDTVGSWSAGTWVWERDSLTTVGTLTVGELLERVPGVITVREGFYGQPETSSAFGTTAGRTEVVLDGYVLDPLRAGTYDWSRLELTQVRRIIVERRLDILRIQIQTLEAFDPRAFAAIEAGVAEPNSKLFRGLFISPSVLHGPLAFAVDHLDTDGAHRSEPASTFSGWAKYAIISGNNGLQFEFRKASVKRGAQLGPAEPVIAPGKGDRTDWVVRARTHPVPGFTGELFYGRSFVSDSLGLVPDSLRTQREAKESQTGARASLAGRWGSVGASARLRDNVHLPRTQADVTASVHPIPQLSIGGEATWADWRTAGSATSYDARAAITPVPMFTIFAETSAGKRGVPVFQPTTRDIPLTDRTAHRAGGEVNFHRLRLGGAVLKVKTDSVASFLLPFDSLPKLYAGGDVTGFEATGTLPLYWKPLSFEGWYQKWQSGMRWIYLPDETIRGALTFHTSPLPSGNLEILARLIGRRRGQMQIPLLDGKFASIPAMNNLDFSLQIRILDLRIFLRYEDLAHNGDVYDIPGRTMPGPRIFYGVRWQFWN
jgi:hypothetical protein